MGFFSFVKDAGADVLSKVKGDSTPEAKGKAVKGHLEQYNLEVGGLDAVIEGERISLTGEVDTLAQKNRILATAGNIKGISEIEDNITVKEEAKTNEKSFYTVKSGDFLSKIAKEVYGDASKYNEIFEANKPMLKDPNLIYPGQTLVIPPLDKA